MLQAANLADKLVHSDLGSTRAISGITLTPWVIADLCCTEFGASAEIW